MIIARTLTCELELFQSLGTMGRDTVNPIVQLRNVSRIFQMGELEVVAPGGLDLDNSGGDEVAGKAR